MRLYGEIFKTVNASEAFAGARCDFFPCGGGYFQGVKTLGSFSTERVVIVFKRADIEVIGKDLSVVKYCEGDLQLSGEIRAVSIIEGSER